MSRNLQASTVRIGLLGFGTIGQGVARLIGDRSAEIARRTGRELTIVAAASRDWDLVDKGTPLPPRQLDDARAVVEDGEVEMVVELMGGLEPARTTILRALELGKPVVTANKAVLAVHGDELFAAAEHYDTPLRFEASVGGAIPILRTLTEGMAADDVVSVFGILNGTCNYILTRISKEGAPFADVLADAQRLGYAEANPDADVDGWDTAHKIAVLARIAFESSLSPERMSVRGIRSVKTLDISAAKELGFKLKLVGTLRRHDDRLEAHVEPLLIPLSHPLAAADGVLNAVLVQGRYAGDIFLMGRGAGAHPTANSVVGDILALAQRGLEDDPGMTLGHLSSQAIRLSYDHDPIRRQYLRVDLSNRAGILAEMAALCGQRSINIQSLLQHGEADAPADQPIPVIFTTTPVADSLVRGLIEDLGRTGLAHGSVAWYPILQS